MRILSGIQPSGKLHIGNYLGMIHQMLNYKDKGDLFCFIANMHSLTSIFDNKKMKENTDDAIIDLLALGIDPEKSLLWVQSDVPEVTELTWYLSTVTPMGLLERCHSYKDKIAKNIPANTGLFTYPVLMAADILLYGANIVPVGRDQKQHVEVTRDIAIKFNSIYGDVFTIPEPEIKEEIAVVPGIDGQKMSKSYNNTIEIFASDKIIKKRIMSILTDSASVDQPKDPEKNNIFILYKLFASEQETTLMAEKFRNGGYGYGDAKKALYEVLIDYFSVQRLRRAEIEKNTDYVRETRMKGAQKARTIASEILSKVRKAVGVAVTS